MKFKNVAYLTASDVSANITGASIDLRYEYGISYIVTLTGSPSGNVIFQVSNDGSNWFTYQSDTISGTTAIVKNLDGIHFAYGRIFKAAGGTGTLSVYTNVKGA